MRKLLIYLFVLSTCSACFDPSYMLKVANLKENVAKEKIVVDRYIDQRQSEIELGFVVYMLPVEAQKIGAPSGIEFIKLLDERVAQEERRIGTRICQHGYKVNSKPPFIGEYGLWEVGFKCNLK